jgi:glutamine amidotransferase
VSKRVVIIDSGGANLASLSLALQRLGAASIVSNDPAEIQDAERVLLPGVGSATAAMQRLRAAGLIDLIPALQQPVLGICLGMQLLFERTAEGDQSCLGILKGSVQRLQATTDRPVPHMGWNQLDLIGEDPLLAQLQQGDYVYFVHSFAATPDHNTLATTDYGGALSAIVRRDNFWGTQFHPERSASVGAQVLANFLEV